MIIQPTFTKGRRYLQKKNSETFPFKVLIGDYEESARDVMSSLCVIR